MLILAQYLYTTNAYHNIVIKMSDDGFRSIRLKEALLNSVEQFILAHPELGYKGMADFVTDAVREKLIELNTQLANSEIKKKAEVAQE